MELEFGTLSSICTEVGIIDDNLLEEDEQFRIILQTSTDDDNAVMSSAIAQVIIIDNESKSQCRLISPVKC